MGGTPAAGRKGRPNEGRDRVGEEEDRTALQMERATVAENGRESRNCPGMEGGRRGESKTEVASFLPTTQSQRDKMERRPAESKSVAIRSVQHYVCLRPFQVEKGDRPDETDRPPS